MLNKFKKKDKVLHLNNQTFKEKVIKSWNLKISEMKLLTMNKLLSKKCQKVEKNQNKVEKTH